MNRATSFTISAAIGASALALALVAPAFAQAPPPPDGKWTGKGQGGLLISSGNTSATSLNARLDLTETNGDWKHIVGLAGLYGKSNDIVSAERVEGRYELDKAISARLFWFGSVDANRDQFSGFNYQATLSTGVGYKFIDSADTKLAGSLGLGYTRLQTQQLVKDTAGAVIERINGDAQGSVVGVAGLNYEQKLTSSTSLFDKLQVTAGSLNTGIANDLGLQVSMSDSLALNLGYGVRYNTKPAAGVKKLDQVTTVNIVYSIK